ncbi:MAG TPA: hypothetical protein VHL80_03970 [Polyangia bacterium]|nr:hypothetical protein [Polyangia bacterium]
MNLRAGITCIGILSTLAIACGGGGSKTLTPDDFCTMKASAECSGAPATCGFTVSQCTDARKAACMAFVTAANVAPRTFVASNVGACISKTTAVFKKSLITADDLDQVSDTCNYVFQGDIKDLDAACTTKYDCKSKSSICDKGQCAPKAVKGTDAQCSDVGAVCGGAQYCMMTSTATKCVDKILLGKACDAVMMPCDDTKMLTCTGGTCVKQSAQGEACASDADCLAAAPYCNPYAGGKCSTGLTFAAGSNSCNDYGGTGSATGFAGSSGGGSGGAGGSTGAAGSDGAAGSTGAAGSDGGSDSANDV